MGKSLSWVVSTLFSVLLVVFPSFSSDSKSPHLIVLGVAQDAGVPQAGSHGHPAWKEPSLRRLATSLGLVDPESGRRWLFEATPDFKEQWYRLAAGTQAAVPDGVFLTHAHIGHYVGLMMLGHEAMGAQGVPVYAMPRMSSFLRQNGPWDQLVRFGNIQLRDLAANRAVFLAEKLFVTPIPVPHRQEYSEVVGYQIAGPKRRALFIPDIDRWEDWDLDLAEVLATVDVAYLDGTFFADGEIPGRDMSGFPHPMITTTMKRLEDLSVEDKAKVRFIHFNHTNPVALPSSEASRKVESSGFRLAREGETFEL